jgi:YVTN family beta-propeller protein
MLLGFFVLLSNNNTFAQTLHNKTIYEMAKSNVINGSNSQIYLGDDYIGPNYIDFNQETNTIYISHSYGKQISVISGEENKKITDIPVGKKPISIVSNPATNTIYVANSGSASIAVINGTTNEKITDIPVGKGPEKIVSNPATNTIYVANFGSNNISVINTTTNEKIKDIPVGNRPIDLVWNYKNNLIYVSNSNSNNISVINATTNEKITDIPVGKIPRAIDWNYKNNLIYVSNYNSSNISVINGTTNEKITDIPVGKKPRAIVSNPVTNTIYVANYNSSSVSVISGEDNKKMPDIPVGKKPISIVSNPATNTIYVANSGSDSVSVISGEDNKKMPDIPVGKKPISIVSNPATNTIYVANFGSSGVSVIDGKVNKVVTGVTFQVKPFYSGYILCHGLNSPLLEYLYLYTGTTCIAQPNSDFEFVSWEENLNDNSTQLIQIAVSHSSTIYTAIVYSLDSIANFIGAKSSLDSIKKFFNIQTDEPERILKITKYGSFTANFRELPPPLPPEYWATLFGVVVTAIIGSWLTPTIVGWRTSKKHQVRLNDYQNKLKELYKDNKLDKNDLSKLDRLRENILSGYTRGDITKDQYDVLIKNLSIQYNEIFHNEINNLKNTTNNEKKIELLNDIQSDLNKVYLEAKIDKEHYDLLKEMISKLNNNKN